MGSELESVELLYSKVVVSMGSKRRNPWFRYPSVTKIYFKVSFMKFRETYF